SAPASSRLWLPASVCHSRTAWSAGTTRTVGPRSESSSVVTATPRASPILTMVRMLGLVRACSIWMSIPRLAPARAARVSRVKPRSVRHRLTLRPRDRVSSSRSDTVRPFPSVAVLCGQYRRPAAGAGRPPAAGAAVSALQFQLGGPVRAVRVRRSGRAGVRPAGLPGRGPARLVQLREGGHAPLVQPRQRPQLLGGDALRDGHRGGGAQRWLPAVV